MPNWDPTERPGSGRSMTEHAEFAHCPSWSNSVSSRMGAGCSVDVKREIGPEEGQGRISFECKIPHSQGDLFNIPAVHVALAFDIEDASHFIEKWNVNPLAAIENDPDFRLTVLTLIQRRFREIMNGSAVVYSFRKTRR